MGKTAFKKAVIPSVEHFTELLDSYYNLNLIHNDCLTHCISNYEITKQMCFILLKYWFKQQQQQQKNFRKVLVTVKNVNWEFSEYINYIISRRKKLV